jgi:hypothetical protein
MSVEGRITVDALFHDKDGTNAINVLSLARSGSSLQGKCAYVSGIVGTAAVTVAVSPSTYRDSSGSLVSFTDVERVVFSCSTRCQVAEASGSALSICPANHAIVLGTEQGGLDGIVVGPLGAGTASFEMVLYGV